MERQASYQSESEARIFAWAQDYDNFTVDPFASFIEPQLDKLKQAAEGAGLNTIQEEMEKQANAYLKKS